MAGPRKEVLNIRNLFPDKIALRLDEPAQVEMVLGEAYQAGLAKLDWYSGGEYVVTDGLGVPVHPEWYPDECGRLLKRAACAGSPCMNRDIRP